jgi:hypothetical protein
MRMLATISVAALLSAGGALLPAGGALAQDNAPGFFITSVGSGDGANLGGLDGADAHCASLASAAGLPDRDWRAYLSATGVNARDRIGTGPWHNVNGVLVAQDLDDLHGEAPAFTKETALNEKGEVVNGRGDTPNQHDILTGSDAMGMLAMAEDGAPLTCGDWTGNGEGSANVGHFDRQGGGAAPTSLNASHASRGCSQEALIGTGGNGYFYCFAAD